MGTAFNIAKIVFTGLVVLATAERTIAGGRKAVRWLRSGRKAAPETA